MSASIPVLVSNFELWNSIIEESKCGFSVDPFSLTEIENTLRFMLDDKELCENLGNAGKMAVLKNYNWKNEEEKLVQFYQKIIR
ncbi:MAG: glycosyltransferase [Salibacteraceae bacterium]|nr:glycosyltransferase [Salibacteraceae bacterium]